MKVKLGLVMNDEFARVINKLYTTPMGFMLAHGVTRMYKCLKELAQKTHAEREDMIKEFGGVISIPDKVEAGQALNPTVNFPDAEKAKEFQTKWNEYMQTEADINAYKLNVNSFGNTIIFTAHELEVISPILTEVGKK